MCTTSVDRVSRPRAPIDLMPVFDRFVARTGAVIRPGPKAGYLPAPDAI